VKPYYDTDAPKPLNNFSQKELTATMPSPNTTTDAAWLFAAREAIRRALGHRRLSQDAFGRLLSPRYSRSLIEQVENGRKPLTEKLRRSVEQLAERHGATIPGVPHAAA
jgi:hypothetical protein